MSKFSVLLFVSFLPEIFVKGSALFTPKFSLFSVFYGRWVLKSQLNSSRMKLFLRSMQKCSPITHSPLTRTNIQVNGLSQCRRWKAAIFCVCAQPKTVWRCVWPTLMFLVCQRLYTVLLPVWSTYCVPFGSLLPFGPCVCGAGGFGFLRRGLPLSPRLQCSGNLSSLQPWPPGLRILPSQPLE